MPPHIAGMFKTKETERLQKIKQTDYSYIDYPGLENDKRWRHSMGVAHLGYELFEKFSREVFEEYGIEMDSMEREIAEREEKEGAKPESTSVEDFKKSMQERGITIYPDNLELVTKVDNHRKKMTFYRDGMRIELAIDDVTNIHPKTNKRVKSKKGEFEIEIKEAQIPVEKQR